MSPNERGPGRGPGRAPARRVFEVVSVVALGLFVAALGIGDDLRRPFSGDEILTYYGSMASGPAELHELLTSGGFDSSPPLYYVAVWQAQRVFGDPHLAIRLPATIGFVALCLCLYAFARRRVPAPYAAVAMLTPAVGWLGYASNGRPYGLMLGLSGLALVAWQSAADGRRRPLALAVLAASLAAGVAAHYYAILLLAPLGLAELTRTFESRGGRPDVPIWAAFGCAFAPLPWLRPLIAHSRAISQGASWLKVDPYALVTTYSFCLPLLMIPIAALAVLLLLRPWISRPRPGPGGGDGPTVPAYPLCDAALILGLVAMPVIAYALGVVVTKAYIPRYAAPFMAGPSLMLAYLGARLFRGRMVFGLLLVGSLLWSLKGAVRISLRPPTDRPWFEDVRTAASRAAVAGRRLLIPLGDEYIRYCYYLGPAGAERLTLVDLSDAMHARIFRSLGRWVSRKGLARYDIREREDYFNHLGDYYFYGEIDRLLEDGPPRPLKYEPLAPPGAGKAADPRFYAIERADGGSR